VTVFWGTQCIIVDVSETADAYFGTTVYQQHLAKVVPKKPAAVAEMSTITEFKKWLYFDEFT